ncbi:bcl-2-interacting killer [Brachyhypopomus gauderio]|uniref:bcl-2-interacting killer n=1 Tax=Brachyhypopomus gauderio TaxID=698409 RepID=UPI004041D837
MEDQIEETSSERFPQAGPSEGENQTVSNTDMRRAVQLIGHRLALIGDELDSRWREKLPNQWPRWPNPNMLTCRVLNGRIIGRIWWSKVKPVVQASWLVPRLHTQNWISLVYNSWFPNWSCRTKCCLASAVLLVTVAVFTAYQETS